MLTAVGSPEPERLSECSPVKPGSRQNYRDRIRCPEFFYVILSVLLSFPHKLDDSMKVDIVIVSQAHGGCGSLSRLTCLVVDEVEVP